MRTLLFLSILLSSLLNVNAQVETGFKFGLSYSNLTPLCVGVNCPFTRYIPGVVFGFTTDISLNDIFTLQPELFYTSKGFEGRPDLTSAEIVSYIALPVLLNFQITPQLGIKAGPEFSYEFNHILVDGSRILDVTNETPRKFDFGLSVGLCIQLTYRWYVDLRFTEGITPFRIDDPRVKYRSFYLSFNRLLQYERKNRL